MEEDVVEEEILKLLAIEDIKLVIPSGNYLGQVKRHYESFLGP